MLALRRLVSAAPQVTAAVGAAGMASGSGGASGGGAGGRVRDVTACSLLVALAGAVGRPGGIVVPPAPAAPLARDIEDAHAAATAAGAATYRDPATGYTVFTAAAHRARGSCCGSACRHCPYGHFSVPPARRARRIDAAVLLQPPLPKGQARVAAAADSDSSGGSGGVVCVLFSGTPASAAAVDAALASGTQTVLLAVFDAATYCLLQHDGAVTATPVPVLQELARRLLLPAVVLPAAAGGGLPSRESLAAACTDLLAPLLAPAHAAALQLVLNERDAAAIAV